MLKGFRDFVLRGNVLDLAVGVIIGAAFGAVVTSLVENIITPLIGAIFGQPDFSAIMLGPLKIGLFLNAVVSFLLVALALYFFIIVPANTAMARFKKPENAPAAPVLTDEAKLLIEIRDMMKSGQPLR
ncbi:MAG: large conductance mechanosensitive channel protein MscL [Roseiflexaceae bacterium]